MYKKILDKISADAILINDPFNMRYISSFSGGEGVLYISRNRDVLITDSRYTQAARSESEFEVIEENARHKRSVILNECIQSDAAASVGFEDGFVTCSEYNKLKEELPRVKKWIPIGRLADDLRMIKSDKELEFMACAASISDRAFENLLALIRPGMTEIEGAAELEYQMKLLGAEDLSFPTIFAAGKNSSVPHAHPSSYKVRPGDFITIDFGCRYGGYCSDTTRTVALSEVSRKQKKVYDTVLKAHNKALSVVKAGICAHEVDDAARSVIRDAGYGEFFGHATGHGVGLFVHENPRYAPGSDTVLKPKMTATVEPGIYIPGEYGVRIEDMIAVTENGYFDFVHLPKELIVI